MKTLSGTFAFIVVAVIAILAVVSFRSFAAGSKTSAVGAHKFRLKIGKTLTDYVDVDAKALTDILNRPTPPFPQDGIDIDYLEKDGAEVKHWPPVPHLSIKTDKVTTSEVAKNASKGEAVANDPNVTRFLSSDSATDIKAVLDTFK
jgi:hypothetical protein